MAVKVPITVEGNLGKDPELGEKDGRPYARLLVVENDRRFNDQTKEWEDVGEPIFHNTVVFGRLAENVKASLREGNAVVVSGDLHFTSYEKDGQRRQGTQIVASTVAPSLKFATAQVQPNAKAQKPALSAEAWSTPAAEATGPVAVPDAGWEVANIPR
ncbi:single-stranded DNA-binding protein [Microbacterium sp. NPDC055988]|uniref:single-stranded DNA-binding protein n=1 Tax=Microbacterium sp. NPDC055988 TaxID=3345671 RepID=UPI0035E38AC6